LKIIFKYTKTGPLKFISHLDTLRALQRALRRGKFPIRYSEGYNPHPKLSIATPLPLGVESIGEYAEIELEQDMDVSTFVHSINEVLPKGMEVVTAVVSSKSQSLPARVTGQIYRVEVFFKSEKEAEIAKDTLKGILDEDYEIIRERKKKQKIVKKTINVPDYLECIELKEAKDLVIEIEVTICFNESGSLKIEELRQFLYNKLIHVDNINMVRVGLKFIDKVV